MRKKTKNQLREEELRAREEAALVVIKANRKKPALKPVEGFAGMTRHQVSSYMARERMRAEAEEIRGNKIRANEARGNQARAKQMLAYIDQQAAS